MGRGPKYTFFQGKHTDGQTHGKMPNITHHRGNANENHNKISPHTCQNGCYQKEHKGWWGWGERGPSYTVGGNVNWCSHCGEQYGGSSKN